MRFLHFFYLCSKIFKGWGWNFIWSFGKVMRSKSMKMVFVARIIRHELCMIYAFFCSKIIFDQKLFSNCWDKLDYPGSIVYLSCLALFCHVLINQGHWLQETLLCKNAALPLVVLEFHETSWKVLKKQICVDFPRKRPA